jgi:tRNA(fMet)-specific endonuclease VapC
VSIFLLDTNSVSDLMSNPRGPVAREIGRVGEERVCVSIIVSAELIYGSEWKRSKALEHRMSEIMRTMRRILPFEQPADRKYGELRAHLRRAGRMIGPNDLLIAAHALALGAVLVTDNVEEFERVPGLVVENWLRQ